MIPVAGGSLLVGGIQMIWLARRRDHGLDEVRPRLRERAA
jgi:hypothetical protein